MICLKPYRRGIEEYRCNSCLPCRLQRRKLWAARMVLESFLHERNAFVTLTYDDKHLPSDGKVSPRDLQLFMKRLREAIAPVKVRFFGVGEYGEVGKRPHYHVILFGYDDIATIRSAWSLGFVTVGTVTPQSCQYAAGYVLKKFDSEAAVFTRMSLRPGIGAGAAEVMAQALLTDGGSRGLAKGQDVPNVYRMDNRRWPLGRYLRRKLRVSVGWSPGAPESVTRQLMVNKAVELINDVTGYNDRVTQSGYEADALLRRTRERLKI